MPENFVHKDLIKTTSTEPKVLKFITMANKCLYEVMKKIEQMKIKVER